MRLRLAMLIVGLAVALSACSGLERLFVDDLSGGDVYVGEDAASITVITEQTGCCYMEGALRFARLDGPSSFDWAVDDGSGGDDVRRDGTFTVGVQKHSVMPGAYTLTTWEQVCGGNCDNLDEPTSHCSLDFTAAPRGKVEIRVTFPVGQACDSTVT